MEQAPTILTSQGWRGLLSREFPDGKILAATVDDDGHAAGVVLLRFRAIYATAQEGEPPAFREVAHSEAWAIARQIDNEQVEAHLNPDVARLSWGKFGTSALLARGWTKRLIKDLLGAPDEVRGNGLPKHGRSNLYDPDRVRDVERKCGVGLCAPKETVTVERNPHL